MPLPRAAVSSCLDDGREEVICMNTREESLRCAADVVAGVLPGQPEDDFTRRFVITSGEWHDADGPAQNALLCDLAGKASGYATFLMVQPDRFNWVKVEWIWF